MSEKQYWVREYNFSRRQVDHRYPYDFFKSINKPWYSLDFLSAFRTQAIGGLISRLSLFTSLVACGIFVVGVEYLNYQRSQPGHVTLKPSEYVSQRYLNNFNNYKANKGKWNNNFACWQNDELCGRDF